MINRVLLVGLCVCTIAKGMQPLNPQMLSEEDACEKYDRSTALESNLLCIPEDYGSRMPLCKIVSQAKYAPLLEDLLTRNLISANFIHQEKKGFFPLIILATAAGVKENVEALLKAKADPDAIGDHPRAFLSKCNPISLAIELERPDLLELILEYGGGSSWCRDIPLPLKLAVDRRIFGGGSDDKIVEIIKLLKLYGADPKKTDIQVSRIGKTITYCSGGIEKKLYDVLTANTALELADRRGYQEIAEELRKK